MGSILNTECVCLILCYFRSNFLKLDIYYSEVKYEITKQSPSYGPLEFFCEFSSFACN
jgi:hypothetical protein